MLAPIAKSPRTSPSRVRPSRASAPKNRGVKANTTRANIAFITKIQRQEASSASMPPAIALTMNAPAPTNAQRPKARPSISLGTACVMIARSPAKNSPAPTPATARVERSIA
ncbi:unannotated protein [freshwater metagenome]|uniref:Unannotated protein n=1 Tax=freshwater metagenome TaxID=449393 RepID=A0A6J7P0A1_9ZZZZ